MFAYLCIKILYLANAVCQLYLMKYFLGYGEDMVAFGCNLAHSLYKGVEWQESLYFPRVSFCSLTVRHLGQRNNRYVGVCALAINMLNEKVYVFLWFWTLAVAIATAFSLFNWILRLLIRRRQAGVIKKYLKLAPVVKKDKKEGADGSSDGSSLYSSEVMDPSSSRTVNRFIKEFLRLDGVFIVQMLTLNAGDVITGEVIRLLWHSWVTTYADRKNFSEDPWEDCPNPHIEMNEIEKEKMQFE